MKKFILIIFLLFVAVEIRGQITYRIEVRCHYPEEQRHMWIFIPAEDIQKVVEICKNAVKDHGYCVVSLRKRKERKSGKSDEQDIAFWFYIGDFSIKDYYEEDINNPLPGLLPIKSNYKIHLISRYTDHIDEKIGITYQIINDEVIPIINQERLRTFIHPCGNLKKIINYYYE